MNCSTFQDLLSDYLDGALDSRARAECAGHRLVCRECRELYNDVRTTVQALGGMTYFVEEPEGLELRILAATTAGEMLSCGEFDRLIERYFDGVMLAPDHLAFQGHFEHCTKCRRLLAGIEEAVTMCREIKEFEVEIPTSLTDRIVSATSGKSPTNFHSIWQVGVLGFVVTIINRLLTPQWAAAGLIFAASLFLVALRFGSLESFASHANGRAEKLLSELNQTGLQARNSLNRVSLQLGNALAKDEKPVVPAKQGAKLLQQATSLTEPLPVVSPTPKLQQATRFEHP